MLKIKEERMQELEKFGFSKSGDCYYYERHTVEGGKLEIEVMQNRIIAIKSNTIDNGDDSCVGSALLFVLLVNDMIENRGE